MSLIYMAINRIKACTTVTLQMEHFYRLVQFSGNEGKKKKLILNNIVINPKSLIC